jgi:hypothetical protein
MKKIFSILTILCLICVNLKVKPVEADDQIFSQLQALKVGSNLDQPLKSELHLNKTTSTNIIYSTPSESPDYLNIIHTDLQDKIIFIQLIIPAANETNFQQQLKKYGQPENTIHYTDLTDLLEFPTQGISFFTDKSHQNIQMVQYYPATLPSIHRQTSGKDYEPIAIILPISPTPTPTTTSPEILKTTSLPLPLIIAAIVSTVLLFLAITVSILFVKRKASFPPP